MDKSLPYPSLSALMLLYVLLTGLGGCGSGSSSAPDDSGGSATLGDSASRQSVSLQGQVGFKPIPGAIVTAFSKKGAKLASTQTDERGQYHLNEIPWQPGSVLTLQATTADAQTPLLVSAFIPQADQSDYSLTALTTMIHQISEIKTLPPSEVAADLQEIGAIGADWLSRSPSSIDLERFALLRGESGFSTTISALATDLADGDVSRASMLLFPSAHGGILPIHVGNNGRVTVFAGTTATAPIDIVTLAQQPEIIVTTNDVPSVRVVQEQGAWTLRYDASGTNGAASKKVTLIATGKQGFKRRAELTIDIIKGERLVTARIGPNGGKLMSADKNIGVIVPAGQLDQATDIQLLRGITNDGDELVGIFADASGSDPVELLFYWLDDAPNIKLVPRKIDDVSTQNLCAAENAVHRHEWERFHAYATSEKAPRIPNINGRTRLDLRSSSANTYSNSQRVHRVGAVLCSTRSQATDDPFWRSHEPVLFIHGYKAGNKLGGGYETWGVFPELVSEMAIGSSGFSTFEFRWRTNTRFQDAANDLALAIQRIHKITKRKVHVVAHSFGGVLARTLTQKVAGPRSFTGFERFDGVTQDATPLIASVTTLGSPHSGIFPKTTSFAGIQFKPGYDTKGSSGAVSPLLCRQISCYQLGDDIVNGHTSFGDIKWAYFYKINQTPGWLAAELKRSASRWPASIPRTVGIGLNTIFGQVQLGDELISWEGQRFFPEDGVQDAKLRSFERIIGASPEVDSLPDDAELIKPKSGYKHAGIFNTENDTDDEYYEAFISPLQCNPNKASACEHGSFLLVKEMLTSHTTTDGMSDIAFRNSKPGNLAVVSFADKAHLSWNLVAGADAYDVYVSPKSNIDISKADSDDDIDAYLVPDTNLVIKIPDDGLLYFKVVAKMIKNDTGDIVRSQPSDEQTISNQRGVVSGRILDAEHGTPIEGAKVSFSVANTEYATTTNERGYYVIRVPATFSSALIKVGHGGYVSDSIAIKRGDFYTKDFLQRDLKLKPVSADIIKIEGGRKIYHLGNDLFEGSVNSQFQTSAIGTRVALTFQVNFLPADTNAQATLHIKTKGVQASFIKSYFYINGHKIRYLPNSPYDGSWGEASLTFDISKASLKRGENTLEVESAYYFNEFYPNNDHYDDFEITDLYIEYLN